jgi:high affinity Mn2+ porin
MSALPVILTVGFKIGASVPYVRVQKAFLRQTIDLGGGLTKIEADQDQFAGWQTANHVVVTVGKFSASDVFDENNTRWIRSTIF